MLSYIDCFNLIALREWITMKPSVQLSKLYQRIWCLAIGLINTSDSVDELLKEIKPYFWVFFSVNSNFQMCQGRSNGLCSELLVLRFSQSMTLARRGKPAHCYRSQIVRQYCKLCRLSWRGYVIVILLMLCRITKLWFAYLWSILFYF